MTPPIGLTVNQPNVATVRSRKGTVKWESLTNEY